MTNISKHLTLQDFKLAKDDWFKDNFLLMVGCSPPVIMFLFLACFACYEFTFGNGFQKSKYEDL